MRMIEPSIAFRREKQIIYETFHNRPINYSIEHLYLSASERYHSV